MTEPITSLSGVLAAGAGAPPARMAIAVGHDIRSLRLAAACQEALAVSAILVGDERRVTSSAREAGLDPRSFDVAHEPSPRRAAYRAACLVGSGEADMLVRGNIGTADLLRAALEREAGLRTGVRWSHVALIETPYFPRLLAVTDGGVNVAPDLLQKAQILNNAVDAMRALGVELPNVAVLAALEQVNPAMPATLDAANLSKMAERGQLRRAVVDGPLALDNAISEESARTKGVRSPVSGRPDVLLRPDIETASILIRSLSFLAGGRIAGAVLGAAAPVIVPSASDLGGSNLESIALGKLLLEQTPVGVATPSEP